MGQPSSPSSADDHVEPRRSPLRELIQLYRTEQAMLAAHQQEVERRRAAVRTAAEEEAAEILLAAKREIRRVLVRTRHELVTLTAQVQAVGRETSPGQLEQPSPGDEFLLSATRDVRSVLRDARAELSTLSRDTSNFWPSGDEARLPAPAIATLPEPAAAGDFSPLSPQTSDLRVDDYSADVPATSVADKIIKYWRPAAVVFAVIAFVFIMIVATRSPSPSEPAVTTPLPESAGAAATAPAPEVPAAAATPPTVRPAATPPSRARPPEPAAATGVTRGTTGQQPPTSLPVTPRSAAETQTASPPNRVAPPPAQDTAAAEREILERHQRWFQAFEHGDRATIASITTDNFSLVDQRPERAPTATGRVEHTIQDVRVRVTAGVGAVLSGRVAETTSANQATVAMLSEVWIRQAEEWRLVSVRMVPLSAVATTLQ